MLNCQVFSSAYPLIFKRTIFIKGSFFSYNIVTFVDVTVTSNSHRLCPKKYIYRKRPSAIDFLVNNDLDGYKAFLNESKENDDYILFDKPECLDT